MDLNKNYKYQTVQTSNKNAQHYSYELHLHNKQPIVNSITNTTRPNQLLLYQQGARTNASLQSVHMHSESLAEEALIEQFKTIITQFMDRPNRHYSYRTNMRWEINHCKKIKYTVIISTD